MSTLANETTYIIVLILWKDFEELVQEYDELLGHLAQFVDIVVCVNIAIASSHGVVDKEEIGEFVPRAIVEDQAHVLVDSVGADFHQGSILGATSRATI